MILLWLENWRFLLSFFLFCWWLLSSLLIPFGWRWLDYNWWRFREFFIDSLIFTDELCFNLELEANNGGNLSNNCLNIKKFVHKSQLKLIIKLRELL